MNIQPQDNSSKHSSFLPPSQAAEYRSSPWGSREDGPNTAFPNSYWNTICWSGGL